MTVAEQHRGIERRLRLRERIIVLATTGADAEIAAGLLAEEGLAAESVGNAFDLAEEIGRGAAMALVAAEALDERGAAAIRDVLDGQPAWSEFPILIFLAEAEDPRTLSPFDVFGSRAHVTLIDRPIRVATLVSATRSALRSRRRQYEVQRLLQERADAAERERLHAQHLASLAEASVAIASARSLDDVLDLLTEQARHILRARFAVTRAVIGHDGTAITTFSSPPVEMSAVFAEHSEPLMEALQKPLRANAEECPSSVLCEHLRTAGARELPRNAISMPLALDDETPLGYIVLVDKDEGDFNEVDESVLTQLAQMASVAVQKARLFREAEQANRAKDDFLATLAHELRTPMTAILGWIQMLKCGDLEGADVASALSMIESSTKVQAHLIEDLLDVSRIIAGKLKIQPAAIELAPLLERVLATFRGAAEEQGVQLLGEIAEEPLSVWGDPTRLQQVMWNLLSNAIKFTPAGGTVRVVLVRARSDAEIRVIDSGEGIDPAFLPHVFERFQQAEQAGTTRAHSGLGLGLAIVRHLVELHGGHVDAASEGPERGATFVVALPIRAVHPLEQMKVEPEALPELSGKRIVVVDDDADAREVLRQVLSRFGADVRATASVAEAVAVLQAFNADLVISDIAMPGEDGYALVRRLHELTEIGGRDIPAVALTGYGREEDQLRILSAGFRRYVQKPVPPVDLARIAADLIGD